MREKFLKLFKDSSIYGISNVIARSLSIFLLPVYLKYLSIEEFGILELSNSLFSFLAIFFILNLDSGLFKIYYDDNSEASKKKKVNLVFTFYVFYGLLFSSLLFLFSRFLAAKIFGSTTFHTFFLIIVFSGYFQGFVQFFLTLFRIKNKPKTYALFNVLLTLFILSLNIYFVVQLNRSYLGIRESFLLAHIAIFFLLFLLNVKHIKLYFNKQLLQRVLRISIPLAASGIASWIINLTDRFMLRSLLPEEIAYNQIGIYGLGGKFSLIIQMLIVVPFMMSWSNFMFKHQHDKDAKLLYAKTFDIMTLLSCIVFISLLTFSKIILEILTKNEAYYQAMEIIPLVVMAKLLFAIFMLFTVGVTLMEKTKHMMYSNISGAVVNISLNFLLIPKLGFVGAAITSLIANIVRSVYLFIVSQKVYHIPYHAIKNLLQLCFAFLIGFSMIHFHLAFYVKIILSITALCIVFIINPITSNLIIKKNGR